MKEIPKEKDRILKRKRNTEREGESNKIKQDTKISKNVKFVPKESKYSEYGKKQGNRDAQSTTQKEGDRAKKRQNAEMQ